MKKLWPVVLVLFLSLAGWHCTEPIEIQNEVRIEFQATNPELADFREGKNARIQSAVAGIKGKVLTLTMSSMEGLNCENDMIDIQGDADFILRITVRTGEPKFKKGEYSDVGVMFFTSLGPYFNTGAEGTVNIQKIGDEVAALFKIRDDRIDLIGECLAPLCPPKSTGDGAVR